MPGPARAAADSRARARTARRASPPPGWCGRCVLLAVVGWAVVMFAARLSEFAARAVGVGARK